MAIHILGNGPSISAFDRDSWPASDVFVGCNFSDPALKPDFVSLIDVSAIKAYLQGHLPAAPVVLSDRALEYADSVSSDWRDRGIEVEAVMYLIRDPSISKDLAMNSAQHGVMYSVLAYSDHSEIHLWGIDSFWTDDMESSTDRIARPESRGRRVRPQITRSWRRYWSKIFKEYPEHRFFIHEPSGVAVEDITAKTVIADHTNVEVMNHE